MANQPSFDDWLDSNGHLEFNVRDLDGTIRSVKIRGGAGAVRLKLSSNLLRGERYYTATVSLEGYK